MTVFIVTNTRLSIRPALSAERASGQSGGLSLSAPRSVSPRVGPCSDLRRFETVSPAGPSSGRSIDSANASAHTSVRSPDKRPDEGSRARHCLRPGMRNGPSSTTSIQARSFGLNGVRSAERSLRRSKERTSTTTSLFGSGGFAGLATFAGTRLSRRTPQSGLSSNLLAARAA